MRSSTLPIRPRRPNRGHALAAGDWIPPPASTGCGRPGRTTVEESFGWKGSSEPEGLFPVFDATIQASSVFSADNVDFDASPGDAVSSQAWDAHASVIAMTIAALPCTKARPILPIPPQPIRSAARKTRKGRRRVMGSRKGPSCEKIRRAHRNENITRPRARTLPSRDCASQTGASYHPRPLT